MLPQRRVFCFKASEQQPGRQMEQGWRGRDSSGQVKPPPQMESSGRQEAAFGARRTTALLEVQPIGFIYWTAHAGLKRRDDP